MPRPPYRDTDRSACGPDHARLKVPKLARDAAANEVETASFRDAHSGEIPRLCSNSCALNTAANAKTRISALSQVINEIAILGMVAETKGVYDSS